MNSTNPFDPSLFCAASRPAGLSRRAFLVRLAGISAALAGLPATGFADEAEDWRAQPPWTVFAAVQDHLLPSGADSPGAREINATGYLRNVLEWPGIDADDKDFLRDGVGWLEDLCRERQGRGFLELDGDQRDAMLRAIAASRAGENWLSLMLVFVFEALLGDPAYGGNPGGIGWKWLEHQPGFPSPPPNKRYFKL